MSSAELWIAITQMPRPFRVVDFPRHNEQGEPVARIHVVVLTQEEQITAAAETERFTKRAIKDLPKQDDARRGYNDVYDNQAAVEILFRACKQLEEPSRGFFPSASDIAKHLTPDEIGVLFRSYLMVQDEIGPIGSRLSAEEVEAWIKRLIDAGSKVPLASLSWGAVSDLAFSLAARSESSATDITSPGSQLDAPSIESDLSTE